MLPVLWVLNKYAVCKEEEEEEEERASSDAGEISLLKMQQDRGKAGGLRD